MDGQTLVIGVVGLGSLGEGIAHALLDSGLDIDVVGVDHDPDAVSRVRRRFDRDRLNVGTDLIDLKRADLVIEAVPEDMAAKEDVLRRLGELCAPGTVLVTGGGALPVAELAIASGCPDRVLGMRFFVPPPHGRAVELVGTSMTSPDALHVARQVAERLGSDVATVSGRPGEAATELVYGYLNQAVVMVGEKYATVEDVDAAMRFGCGLPYGPLRLVDLIGADTVRDTLRGLHRRTGNGKFAPAPLLDRMTDEGHLGRKTGRGFYDYADDGEPTPRERGERHSGTVRPVNRIGVVGSGTMARGITEVAARAGIPVTLVARTADRATAAFDAVDASLGRAEQRGRISEGERIDVLYRIDATDDFSALAGCDLLIEAVAEDLAVKRAILRRMDTVAGPGAILASSTSSLSVTECARATSRPAEVIGLHFFNPAPVMKLVEVVRTEDTAADVLATAHALVGQLGKHAVDCTDRAGFIVNHLLFPYLNDAIRMLGRTDVTVEEIDTAVTTAFGHPMGPFALLDTIGLDVSLAILHRLSEAGAEPGLAPAAALGQLVAAGHLGRKTGSGFRVVKRAGRAARPAATA